MSNPIPGRATAESKTHRRAVINVRVPIGLRELIDRAADILGKTRTDFILDSARTLAIDVLLDQRLFTLDADQYESLVQALESPPPPNEKLKRLFRSKAPWER